MAKALDTKHRQALVYAPLWVYSAVAGADGPPEPSQFRRFLEELDTAEERLAASPDAGAALASLRANIDATFDAYQADGTDPRRGLKRVRDALKRVPDDEAATFTAWLLGLAVRIGGVRHISGDALISENEAQAIHDIASWLDVDSPDLSTRDTSAPDFSPSHPSAPTA
jgi:hypothetical protein